VIRKSDATFREADYWAAVAGSGIVLQDGGKPEGVIAPANNPAHPRTAVGVSQDGRYLILLVIDGRQPGYSEGATLGEVADWLIRFGAHDGLNLDGGGSTTLVREERDALIVVNRPSGAARRPAGGDDQLARVRGQRSNGNHLGVRARPLPAR
jgi:exopolysaccharide biosynthesis protein